jgi:hypothetical protein
MARILKLTEEIGETSQAVIGVIGENPRKGGVTQSDQCVPRGTEPASARLPRPGA